MLRHLALRLYSRLAFIRYQMNPTCIFCKIAAGEASAIIVYKDEQVTAFRDKHPVAQTHGRIDWDFLCGDQIPSG